MREELEPSGVGLSRVRVLEPADLSTRALPRGPSKAEHVASPPPFVAVEPYPEGNAFDQKPLSYLTYATLPYSTYRDNAAESSQKRLLHQPLMDIPEGFHGRPPVGRHRLPGTGERTQAPGGA